MESVKCRPKFFWKLFIGFGSFVVLLGSSSCLAAQTKKAKAPVGVVVNEGAIIYKEPNFDAEVLAYAQAGKKLDMSTKLVEGVFYKVRLKPGVTGFIADTDISLPGKDKDKIAEAKGADEERERRREENSRKKPFSMTQFVGLSGMSLNYKERTMDRNPTDTLTMLGLKLFGPNLVFEGLTVSEINFLISTAPPKYYEQATGRPANGFLLLGDFLFQSLFPMSRDSLINVGFGPMFRYNKYDVQLVDSSAGKVSQFAMEDFALGLALNLGLGLRAGPIALRLEAKYHYEYSSYLGFGGSIQYGF